jgi:MFS family permease
MATRSEPVRPVHWDAGLWALLLVLSANMLIDAIEVSTVIVAMPSIGTGLGLPLSAVHWTMTAFTLGFGATLPFAGWVVARYGRRLTFLAALMVFAVASLAGALAGDLSILVISRLVKGICVAFTAPIGLAIISTTFPAGAPRTRAVSIYSLAGASGFTVGLVLSGVLTELSWRWTLALPAPVSLVLLVLAWRLIPGERDRPEPLALLPSAVLKRPGFARSAAGAALLNGSFWGLLVIGTFHLQAGARWSPLQTGLAFLPASALLGLAVPLSGLLVARFGAARLIAVGAVFPPIGYALYYPAGPEPSYPGDILPTMLLSGLGFALGFAALHLQAVSKVPDEERGIASGLYQAAVQLGGALAVVVVVVLTASVDGRFGFRPALDFVLVLGVGGLVIALAGLRDRDRLLT